MGHRRLVACPTAAQLSKEGYISANGVALRLGVEPREVPWIVRHGFLVPHRTREGAVRYSREAVKELAAKNIAPLLLRIPAPPHIRASLPPTSKWVEREKRMKRALDLILPDPGWLEITEAARLSAVAPERIATLICDMKLGSETRLGSVFVERDELVQVLAQ